MLAAVEDATTQVRCGGDAADRCRAGELPLVTVDGFQVQRERMRASIRGARTLAIATQCRLGSIPSDQYVANVGGAATGDVPDHVVLGFAARAWCDRVTCSGGTGQVELRLEAVAIGSSAGWRTASGTGSGAFGTGTWVAGSCRARSVFALMVTAWRTRRTRVIR